MKNLLQLFRGRRAAPRKHDRSTRGRFRPAVEALEDRCLMVSTPVIQLVPVITTGISNPLLATNAHDGSNRLFIVEQSGRIQVRQPGGAVSVFLDISANAVNPAHRRVLSGGEQGLLGLAFHPQYASNGLFYVHHTRTGLTNTNDIVEYQVNPANPNLANPDSERLLLRMPQPFSNHNGGSIEFGPDGFLYIGKGDGGSANDPGNRAQNINELLGKILRIDVNGDDFPADPNRNYAIPPDNPFAGPTPGADEVYAVGMRNPFRFSFDRQTGELYVGDVGQNAREEIDIVTLGGNYGWRAFEGFIPNPNPPPSGPPRFPAEVAALEGIAIPPITDYAHIGGGRSVTGGYVYRGTQGSLPAGSYIFADFITGQIFWYNGPPGTAPIQLSDETFNISSFGEDEDGELYVVRHGTTGGLFRIINPNQPPVLAPIDDQFITSATDVVTVPLSATDPDGDPVTFAAGAQSLAFVLDGQLGLFFAGDLFENFFGQNERWLLGDGDQWYFILPNGELYAWDGTAAASGTLVGVPGASYWNEIDLLYNAQEAAALDRDLGLSFTGDLFENFFGQNERWLLGSGNQWYFILPNGELYAWDGSDAASGTLVGTPGASYYSRIQFLYDGQDGQAPASLSIDGSTLTIDRDDGFIGSLLVFVLACDDRGGIDAKVFSVIVTLAP